MNLIFARVHHFDREIPFRAALDGLGASATMQFTSDMKWSSRWAAQSIVSLWPVQCDLKNQTEL